MLILKNKNATEHIFMLICYLQLPSEKYCRIPEITVTLSYKVPKSLYLIFKSLRSSSDRVLTPVCTFHLISAYLFYQYVFKCNVVFTIFICTGDCFLTQETKEKHDSFFLNLM